MEKVIKPLIVCGPSGVGKGTIIKAIRTKFSSRFGYSISYTTRNPRPGETNGVEYFFVSEQEFKQEVEKNNFVENCYVHGKYYGTHISQLNSLIQKKLIPILEIDTQGAQKIYDQHSDWNFVFIQTSEFGDIEKRLRERQALGLTVRGTETEEQIKLRVVNSLTEIEAAQRTNFYTYIHNDDLAKAIEDFENYLKQKYDGF